MSAGMYFNKSLEVSAETMRQLRYEGLTNHQIAKRCGCSEATVYRYIGKKSRDVMNAAITNKPCPVKEEPTPAKVDSPFQLPSKKELKPAANEKFSDLIKPSNSILAKSAETLIKEEQPMENPAPVAKKFNDRKKLDPEVIAKIYELHDQGMSATKIGKELGISLSTAARYVNKYEQTKEPVAKDIPAKVIQPKVKMKLVTMAKGEVCDYKVDLSSGSIDISGVLQGILDKDTIDNVIDELTQIRSLMMG